jgi:hypothetical protein
MRNSGSIKRENRLMLEDIRNVVLVALVEFSKQHAEYNNRGCPTVGVDGKGHAKEIEIVSGDDAASDTYDCGLEMRSSQLKDVAQEIRKTYERGGHTSGTQVAPYVISFYQDFM